MGREAIIFISEKRKKEMVSKPVFTVLMATAMYSILKHQETNQEILAAIQHLMRTLLKVRDIHR